MKVKLKNQRTGTYASQRPPGPITFFKGLHNFNLIYEGWCIAKKF